MTEIAHCANYLLFGYFRLYLCVRWKMKFAHNIILSIDSSTDSCDKQMSVNWFVKLTFYFCVQSRTIFWLNKKKLMRITCDMRWAHRQAQTQYHYSGILYDQRTNQSTNTAKYLCWMEFGFFCCCWSFLNLWMCIFSLNQLSHFRSFHWLATPPRWCDLFI